MGGENSGKNGANSKTTIAFESPLILLAINAGANRHRELANSAMGGLQANFSSLKK